jgi:transaldolase
MTQNSNSAALAAAGASVWLDDLSRDWPRTGDLAELIQTTSVVRVTANPTTFHHAPSKRYTYGAPIREACEELNAAAGTRQKCRAGGLSWNGR